MQGKEQVSESSALVITLITSPVGWLEPNPSENLLEEALLSEWLEGCWEGAWVCVPASVVHCDRPTELCYFRSDGMKEDVRQLRFLSKETNTRKLQRLSKTSGLIPCHEGRN